MNLLSKNEIFSIYQNCKIVIFDLEGIIICSGENRCQNFGKCNYDRFAKICEKLKEDNKIIAIITGATLNENQKCLISVDYLIQSSLDKVGKAEKLLKELGVGFDQTAFIADGLLDIPLLEKVALPITVKSARREVKRYVKYICKDECALCELLKIFSGDFDEKN